jgi:hypothetical protein
MRKMKHFFAISFLTMPLVVALMTPTFAEEQHPAPHAAPAPHAPPAPRPAPPAAHAAPPPHAVAPAPHVVAPAPHIAPPAAPAPHVAAPSPVQPHIPSPGPQHNPMPSNAEHPIEPPQHAMPMPSPHGGFGPHAREQQPGHDQQQLEQHNQRQQEGRGGEQQNAFAPHRRTGDERLVRGHIQEHDRSGFDVSGHHHFRHFGEHGYYQDGQWYPDDGYPVYQDTMPDDGVAPPVAMDMEDSGSSVCYVNIPQDEVLDVRDAPSGDTVVSSLENGTDVAVVDQQQTWLLIKLDNPNNTDNLGWVLQDYVQCSNDRQE